MAGFFIESPHMVYCNGQPLPHIFRHHFLYIATITLLQSLRLSQVFLFN